MLVSPVKQRDREDYLFGMSILQKCINLYKKNCTDELEDMIHFWVKENETLEKKMKGDYTEADRRYNTVYKHLDEALEDLLNENSI